MCFDHKDACVDLSSPESEQVGKRFDQIKETRDVRGF